MLQLFLVVAVWIWFTVFVSNNFPKLIVRTTITVDLDDATAMSVSVYQSMIYLIQFLMVNIICGYYTDYYGNRFYLNEPFARKNKVLITLGEYCAFALIEAILILFAFIVVIMSVQFRGTSPLWYNMNDIKKSFVVTFVYIQLRGVLSTLLISKFFTYGMKGYFLSYLFIVALSLSFFISISQSEARSNYYNIFYYTKFIYSENKLIKIYGFTAQQRGLIPDKVSEIVVLNSVISLTKTIIMMTIGAVLSVFNIDSRLER